MILVTGATGNVGTELVQQLIEKGHPVRALVRSRTDATSVAHGAEAALGDLDRADSLGDALRGVSRVFLLGGFHDMPGVLAAIRAAGAQHVVMLSSRSVIGGNPSNAIVKMWMTAEDAVQRSGVAWTVMRASGFMSNALRWLPQLRAGDVVRVPFASVPVASIDPADIAACARAALTTATHASRTYAITGPEPLLPEEMLRILAAVLGRDLRLVPQTDDEARAEMSQSMAPETVDAFFRFFAHGEFDDSTVLPTVHELTGRPPRTFDEWAHSHAHLFSA
jgi:uncharacterized protein YbjT (DUF2867 family)